MSAYGLNVCFNDETVALILLFFAHNLVEGLSNSYVMCFVRLHVGEESTVCLTRGHTRQLFTVSTAGV